MSSKVKVGLIAYLEYYFLVSLNKCFVIWFMMAGNTIWLICVWRVYIDSCNFSTPCCHTLIATLTVNQMHPSICKHCSPYTCKNTSRLLMICHLKPDSIVWQGIWLIWAIINSYYNQMSHSSVVMRLMRLQIISLLANI